MAKLQREAKIRERRVDKAARKQLRKAGLLDPSRPDEFLPEAADTIADVSPSNPEPGVGL